MAYYVDEDIGVTIAKAVRSLQGHVKPAAVYLFGSQADGTAGPDSDIDLAAFVEREKPMNLPERVELAVSVQREAGDRIELHVFPASSLQNPEPASFAEYVIEHGKRIDLNPGS